jgi:hypothetical protein
VFLLAKPELDVLRDTRAQLGLGLRTHGRLWGIEWSYGVGIRAELRLEDHYWLAYATPLELGAILYAKNSWRVQLLVGVRSAFAGQLVNHFLIDPNGYDSAAASENLERVRTRAPWLGFVRLVYGRVLD